MEEIASLRAEQTGVDAGTILDYLENRIIYDLGEEEQAGLRHFQQLAHQLTTNRGDIEFRPLTLESKIFSEVLDPDPR